MTDQMRRWSSRKFLVVEQAIILSFVLALMDKLTPTWGSVISVSVTAYHFANSYVEGKKLSNGD